MTAVSKKESVDSLARLLSQELMFRNPRSFTRALNLSRSASTVSRDAFQKPGWRDRPRGSAGQRLPPNPPRFLQKFNETRLKGFGALATGLGEYSTAEEYPKVYGKL